MMFIIVFEEQDDVLGNVDSSNQDELVFHEPVVRSPCIL